MSVGFEPSREFKYFDLPTEDRNKLTDLLKRKLEEESGILLAYLHGGFLKGRHFRDIDIAFWIKDEDRAWYYAVNLSAELEIEIGIPVDIQVMNNAQLPLRHEVLTNGKLIISRDDGLKTRLLDETLRLYIDLQQVRDKSKW